MPFPSYDREMAFLFAYHSRPNVYLSQYFVDYPLYLKIHLNHAIVFMVITKFAILLH